MDQRSHLPVELKVCTKQYAKSAVPWIVDLPDRIAIVASPPTAAVGMRRKGLQGAEGGNRFSVSVLGARPRAAGKGMTRATGMHWLGWPAASVTVLPSFATIWRSLTG